MVFVAAADDDLLLLLLLLLKVYVAGFALTLGDMVAVAAVDSVVRAAAADAEALIRMPHLFRWFDFVTHLPQVGLGRGLCSMVFFVWFTCCLFVA